jgi:hypothetical protein
MQMSPNLIDAMRAVWTMIAPDAGACHAREAVEMILDRVNGDAAHEVDRLIEVYGYPKVSALAVKTLFR